jgi:16S rRNA G966 N2-methylase RsmD
MSKADLASEVEATIDNILIIDQRILLDTSSGIKLTFMQIFEYLETDEIQIIKYQGIELVVAFFFNLTLDDMFKEIEMLEGFDTQHGTDTGEIIDEADLGGSSEQQNTNVRYVATPLFVINQVFEALDIDFSQYHFVDVGCGKGRVVTLSTNHVFKSYTGIEYSEKLTDIAKNNISKMAIETSKIRKIKIINQDVRDYSIPTQNTVFYMYFPFSVSILEPFLKKIHTEIYMKGHSVVFSMVEGLELVEHLMKCDWLTLVDEVNPSLSGIQFGSAFPINIFKSI